MLRISRLRLWPRWGGELCASWLGCCSTGWEHQWRSGRCRPLCCCGLYGSAGLPWSWRALRCCHSPLTSDHSETESGNTCRTEKKMEGKIMDCATYQLKWRIPGILRWIDLSFMLSERLSVRSVQSIIRNHALVHFHVLTVNRYMLCVLLEWRKWFCNEFLCWQRRWRLTLVGSLNFEVIQHFSWKGLGATLWNLSACSVFPEYCEGMSHDCCTTQAIACTLFDA